MNKQIDFQEIGKMRSTTSRVGDPGLICYGCAHSIGDAPPPSGPSGERPCQFCVRNPKREESQKYFEEKYGKKFLEWYDGSPIAFYPIDAYQTMDMKEQMDRWIRRAKGDENWNEPQGGLKFG